MDLGKSKSSKGKDGRSKDDASTNNRLKQLAESNKKMRRQIKALKRKSTKDDTPINDDDSTIDAGDEFGGKASKKSKKK